MCGRVLFCTGINYISCKLVRCHSPSVSAYEVGLNCNTRIKYPSFRINNCEGPRWLVTQCAVMANILFLMHIAASLFI